MEEGSICRGDPSIWENDHSETKVSWSETQHVNVFFFFTIFRETHAMFAQVGINCLVREFSECGLMCVTGEEWVIFMSCSGSVADLEVE